MGTVVQDVHGKVFVSHVCESLVFSLPLEFCAMITKYES